MSNGTSFDSTKVSLEDILKDIKAGKIQLPDFQMCDLLISKY